MIANSYSPKLVFNDDIGTTYILISHSINRDRPIDQSIPRSINQSIDHYIDHRSITRSTKRSIAIDLSKIINRCMLYSIILPLADAGLMLGCEHRCARLRGIFVYNTVLIRKDSNKCL